MSNQQNWELVSERFPSGQRGQTVNLLAMPSEVRILPSPPGLLFEVNGLKDENLSPTRGGEGGSATPTESGEAERAKRASTSSPLHQVYYLR